MSCAIHRHRFNIFSGELLQRIRTDSVSVRTTALSSTASNPRSTSMLTPLASRTVVVQRIFRTFFGGGSVGSQAAASSGSGLSSVSIAR